MSSASAWSASTAAVVGVDTCYPVGREERPMNEAKIRVVTSDIAGLPARRTPTIEFVCDLSASPGPAVAAAENDEQHDNENDPSGGTHGSSWSTENLESTLPIRNP